MHHGIYEIPPFITVNRSKYFAFPDWLKSPNQLAFTIFGGWSNIHKIDGTLLASSK